MTSSSLIGYTSIRVIVVMVCVTDHAAIRTGTHLGRLLEQCPGAWQLCAKKQGECQQQNAERLHMDRLRKLRNGHRIISRIVPAKPSTNPPMEKTSNHQVLKSWWFFQSMMWRLQKKS